MEFKKEIFIFRHGESVANKNKIACGNLDYPLSTKGILQAKNMAKKLNLIKFDRLYVSNLERTKQTAKFINFKKATFVNEIIEINNGDFSKMKIKLLHKIHPKYKYQGLIKNTKYPNGESLNQALKRVWKWFDAEEKKWNKKKILIIGHELTICAILIKKLKINYDNYPIFNIDNCNGIIIKYLNQKQFRIQFVN